TPPARVPPTNVLRSISRLLSRIRNSSICQEPCSFYAKSIRSGLLLVVRGDNFANAFLYNDDAVCRDIRQPVDNAAGPAHLDDVGARYITQPEMQPRIVRRLVAHAALCLVGLGHTAGRQLHARADTIAVRSHAGQPQREPVVAVAAIVTKQLGRLPVVGDE